MLPFNFPGSTLFGQAHAEFHDFWKRPPSTVYHRAGMERPGLRGMSLPSTQRLDVSLGGGWRKLVGQRAFVGINGFYDTTRLNGTWYSSQGIGLESVAILPSDGMVDISFNWYGRFVDRAGIIHIFRRGPSNFDLELGYSQPILDGRFDLRVKGAFYRYDIGEMITGQEFGAQLTTGNGLFSLKVEHADDALIGQRYSIGGYVNMGFRLENLLRGESPFTLPEPVTINDRRNLRRMLSEPVRRNWRQSTQAVQTRGSAPLHAFQLVQVRHCGLADSTLVWTPGSNHFTLIYNGLDDVNDICFTFRTSDGNLRQITASVTCNGCNLWGPPGWSGYGNTPVGPTMMTSNPQDSLTLWGPIWLDPAWPGGNGAIVVSAPDYVPLVITYDIQ